MRKTMKALVKKKAEPGLWLDEVPVPSVGINDVLIRVDRTGICGTDLHIYQWNAWAQRTIPVPMVVGHEFVGEVVEVGSNVADFFPGDVVSGEGHVVCGRCRNCLAGRRHLCKDTKGIGVNRPGAIPHQPLEVFLYDQLVSLSRQTQTLKGEPPIVETILTGQKARHGTDEICRCSLKFRPRHVGAKDDTLGVSLEKRSPGCWPFGKIFIHLPARRDVQRHMGVGIQQGLCPVGKV